MSDKGKSIDVFCVLFDVGLMLENSAVFQSQVGEQLLFLQSIGYQTGLIAIYQDKEKFNTAIGNRLKNAGVLVYLVKNQGFFGNLVSMPKTIRSVRSNFFVRNFYVRGLWGPLVLKLTSIFKTLSYVYDIRGDLEDEFQAVQYSPFKKLIYMKLEHWGIQGASNVTAVSQPLADKFSLRFTRRVHVIPCCINFFEYSIDQSNSKYSRTDLGFSESDIVFIYSGGLSHYQQVPAMLELWQMYLGDPQIKFLLLTNEDPHSHPITINGLANFNSKLKHYSLTREEIPHMLAVGNIGFMLRDSRDLNKAASPVKFPEYLSAGLAVVGSKGIGDASRIIDDHNVGVLIDPQNIRNEAAILNNLINNIRKEGQNKYSNRATKLASTLYNWGYYSDVFEVLYKRV